MGKATKKAVRKKATPREKKVDVNNPLTLPTIWKGLEGNNVNLEDYAGFVYCITNKVSGRKYIGRKYLWGTRRTKVVGRVNRKRRTSPSNWKHYKGSCVELQEDIKKLGLDSFLFEIVWLCKTRRDTNYKELEEQVKRDVLHARNKDGEFAYYNGLIIARIYRERTKNESC